MGACTHVYVICDPLSVLEEDEAEVTVCMGQFQSHPAFRKHEVPVMYLTQFPKGNLSIRVRKLIIEVEVCGHLSGAAEQKLEKGCPSWLPTINAGACHCGRWPLCTGKPNTFYSCTFKEHQVPKKAQGTFSQGCVFCESSFMSRRFHGEHAPQASHPAQSFICLCTMCPVLPSPSLFSAHAIQGSETSLLLYKGSKRTDLTSGNPRFYSTSATIQRWCHVSDNFLHFLPLTCL